MDNKINILEKIEYVHATLQEQREQTAYTDMIDNSLLIIEEIREKYIGEKNDSNT
tara:strand:+ start:136 stop:300 length:165 start_codon:yes stop_codon:yes gene_type:complete